MWTSHNFTVKKKVFWHSVQNYRIIFVIIQNMCYLSPVFLHIFFENVIPELCNCYNWDLFKNSKNSKFFSIFVTCHHLHYFVSYESKKLWCLDNAKMLSIFSNRVDINFFGIYKFRLVSNHKKHFNTLWNLKSEKGWPRKLCVIVNWGKKWEEQIFFSELYYCFCTN